MQTNMTQKREDIEAAIEECKETIYEHRHDLRWFKLAFIFFCILVGIAFVAFAIIDPLHIPYVQSVIEPIGGTAVVILILLGVGIIACFNFFDGLWNALWGAIVDLHDAKLKLKKLYRQLAFHDEQALRHLSPEQYMNQLPGLISSYRKRADRYRRWFTAISITTILLSAGITSLSGGWLDKYFSIPWIIPVLSASISILTSVTLFFKFREKGANLQQTSDTMDWEHMACTLGIGLYKGMIMEERLVLLASRVEDLRKEQQQKQLQLEQSSHAEQKALQSAT